MTPLERVRSALEAAGSCKGPGKDWRCPAHDDQQASLSVTVGDEGGAVLHCHAGCRTEDVIAAIGLGWADLFPAGRNGSSKPEIVATYDYTDPDGTILYQAVRYFPKAFKRRRPDGHGGWTWTLNGPDGKPAVRKVLYRLPDVLAAASAGGTVYVVEGEKDVHALERAGVVATTILGGADQPWLSAYTKALDGADVTVVADNDEAGHRFARKVAAALALKAIPARVVRAAEGKDASDHVAAGHGLDDFLPLPNEPEDAQAVAEPAMPQIQVARADGAEILEEIERQYRAYVAWANDHQVVAVTLWTAHTHAAEASDTTPYLAIESAEPESGKTRTLEVAEHLTARAWMLVEPSEAAMFRKIERDRPTILLDEADALWGAKADGREGLRALLNAGYRRGATVPRCVGEGTGLAVQDFPVYGPKALAGLAGNLPRTIASRSIPIRLRRRAKGEQVERFRAKRAAAELGPLRLRLAAWVELVSPELEASDPEIPEALSDRQADCWEPLLAIADAVGGDLPQRARLAAVELHGRDPAADSSIGVLLLDHLREAFLSKGSDELGTATLLEALVERDDGPWAEWWGKAVDDGKTKGPASRLAYLLKGYGIKPKQLKIDGENTRGYAREGFVEAWTRYLTPGSDSQDATLLPRRSEGLFNPDADLANMAPEQGGSEVASGNTLPGSVADDGQAPAVATDPEQAFEWRFEDAPVGACASCGEQCHTRDPDGQPRHPLCPAPDRRRHTR
jgi:5S rRNA maturation endonuclease (ribonuclease M5)